MTEVVVISAGHAEHAQEVRSEKPEGRAPPEGHREDERKCRDVKANERQHRVPVVLLALECNYCHLQLALSLENAGWRVPGCGPPAVKQSHILSRGPPVNPGG